MAHLIYAATFLAALCNTFLVFQILKTFIPIRQNVLIQIAAFILFRNIANIIIYAHDAINIVGVLLGFLLYIFIFYKGDRIRKISTVFIFYPMIVSLNFLTLSIGENLFYSLENQSELISDFIFLLFMVARTLVWSATLRFCRRWTKNIMHLMNGKMWLLIDCICISMFTGILVALNFLPEAAYIVYPICLASIITVLGCLYLSGYIAGTIQMSYQYNVLQSEYKFYEEKLENEKRIRSIYHDMKNHLLLLQSRGSDIDSGKMIESLQKQMEGYENYYKTGNSFLDIIIWDKAKKAKREGIDFNVVLEFSDAGFLEPLDISTIFGNAIDNSIEASREAAEEERLIKVKARRIGDLISIMFENNMVGGEHQVAKSGKRDKFLHGLGIGNIEKAVEKYQGQCAIKQEWGWFKLKIIIPIP